MNRRIHGKSEFLSLKTIIILSLGISLLLHLLFIIAFYFGETVFVPPVKLANRPPLHIGRMILYLSLNFIMVFSLFLYNRKMMSLTYKHKYGEIVAVILGSFLITVVLSLTFSAIPTLCEPETHGSEFIYRKMRDGLLRDLCLMVIVILASQLMRLSYNQRVIAVENEMLRTEHIRTRFEALKNQMDPHFLFNSLNTLQSLVDTDTDKAGEYIQQLSCVLRSSLQNKETITLEDEMKCVRAYCSMLQIRYGDNLDVVYRVDDKYRSYLVLPLSLQGLVENAVKHNVISAKQPLSVSIFTTDDDTIVVSNTIQQKIEDEQGSGIGLANLAERYRLKWNLDIVISDDANEFKVTLPLVKENA